jgi:hypothetical protein
MNYSIDDDLYRAYARLIVNGTTSVHSSKKYFCCYIGRKDQHYAHSHEDIRSAYGHRLAEYDRNPELFRQAMGNERYILRAPTEAEIFEMADYILEKR